MCIALKKNKLGIETSIQGWEVWEELEQDGVELCEITGWCQNQKLNYANPARCQINRLQYRLYWKKTPRKKSPN